MPIGCECPIVREIGMGALHKSQLLVVVLYFTFWRERSDKVERTGNHLAVQSTCQREGVLFGGPVTCTQPGFHRVGLIKIEVHPVQTTRQ